MANEITIQASLKAVKGELNIQTPPTTVTQTIDMSGGPEYAAGGQIIGTTHETISVGDVGTEGWAWFKNLDSTNYVEIGVDVAASFYGVIRLNAGEWCVARLSDQTYYARANTANVTLGYVILEA